MKKNKKMMALLMSMVMACSLLVACGSDGSTSEGSAATDNISADTLGGKYTIAFMNTDSDDPAEVADQLIADVENDMGLVAMEVEPGYLNGFDNEIKGFSKGQMFSPMIGSIPFVGYVFTADDPAALEATLKENANLRWNICTEADEMVSATKGNLVFFMMCTNEN